MIRRRLTIAVLAMASFAAGLLVAPPLMAQQPATPVLAVPSAGLAETRPDLFGMLAAMGVYEMLAILGAENIAGAGAVDEGLMSGQGGSDWVALVSALHAPDRLARLFEAAFPSDALSDGQIADIAAFAGSDAGRRIVAAEIATRALFVDEQVLDDARAAFHAAIDRREPRLEILFVLNEVNGFVERNVSGALNQSFAFYRGLSDGDALHGDMSEAVLIDQVWSQEAEVRRMTVEWLFAYQLAAYAGLEDADLQAYVDFGRTGAGQAVNAALFAAFDAVLGHLSYDMGTGAARFITGQDI